MPPPRLTQSTWSSNQPKRSRDQVHGPGERVEVGVLAVEVEHHAVELRRHGPQRLVVGDAEARVRPGRVGEIEVGGAHARIDPHADRYVTHERSERLQLADRVEDHLVGERGDGGDLVGVPGHAVGVDLPRVVGACRTPRGRAALRSTSCSSCRRATGSAGRRHPTSRSTSTPVATSRRSPRERARRSPGCAGDDVRRSGNRAWRGA